MIWLATAGLLVLAVFFPTDLFDRGPRYRGRSVNFWFSRLAEGDHGVDNEVVTAFQAFGTNAVPHLIPWLRYRNTRIDKVKTRLWSKLPLSIARRVQPPLDAPRIHHVAMGALLIAARKDFGAAVPALIDLARHGEPGVRMQAIDLLGMLDREREQAIPVLLETLRESQGLPTGHPDRAHHCEVVAGALGRLGQAQPGVLDQLKVLLGETDARCRLAAADALWRLGTSPDEILPVTTSELTNRSPAIRQQALLYLSYMGHDASTALPKVRPLLNDSEHSVRSWASNIVKRLESSGGTH